MQTEQTSKDLRETIIEWVLNNPETVERPFRLPATLLDGDGETHESRRIAKETLHDLGFEKRQVYVKGVGGSEKKLMWVRHANQDH